MSEEIEIAETYPSIEQSDAVARYNACEWQEHKYRRGFTQCKLEHNGLWVRYQEQGGLRFRAVGKFPKNEWENWNGKE
jgi:hypothetical protein